MKNLVVFCLLFSVSCCLSGLALTAAAEEEGLQHLSTGKILEFSLSSLKESLEKISQKNERLAFENEMLRKSINDLQREKEFLTGKKDALSGGLSAPEYEKKVLQPMKIADQVARRKRTDELINVFQRDIVRLKEEIRVLEDSLSGEEFNARRRMLLEKSQESKKNLVQAEKKLKFLEQENAVPGKKIEALQKEQDDLAQEVRSLEGPFRGF
jgi:chromosome segregation ATPase